MKRIQKIRDLMNLVDDVRHRVDAGAPPRITRDDMERLIRLEASERGPLTAIDGEDLLEYLRATLPGGES